jgi:AcrR family transcriptional regulator
MPYPPGHRAATRQKIVESARRLFNQHGFDSVSVRQIMAGAGLTHGGFYDYFDGKSSQLTTDVTSQLSNMGCHGPAGDGTNRSEIQNEKQFRQGTRAQTSARVLGRCQPTGHRPSHRWRERPWSLLRCR